MIGFNLATVSLLAFIAVAKAAPQDLHILADRAPAFTWTSWVQGIVDNPTGDNLTPEQALQASNMTLQKNKLLILRRISFYQSTDPVALGQNSGTVTCNTRDEIAVGPAAATCINDLASRGTETCRALANAQAVCNFGGAALVITSNLVAGLTMSCGDVAIAAGAIMDACFTPQQTVEGSNAMTVAPNNVFQLFIVSPTSDLIHQAQ